MIECTTMHLLRFHCIHGKSIILSEDSMVATRAGDFCNGIAFSAQPVKVGQKVCLELTQVSEWSGAIRIGFTVQDPSKISTSSDLPKYACPDLTNKEGNWARALREGYAESGNRVTFYVNAAGQMHYFVNNEHKGIFLNHLPTHMNLWLLLDIYGNTNSAKFVAADEAPVEIVARGPDAMRAYHKACESGTQPVFRTRLMLVGQDRVGKTSLKKSLTGQRHNTKEESTDGIDLSASCSFNLRDRKVWKLAIQGEPNSLLHNDNKPLGVMGGIEGLEEEYYQALANNIVQELLYRQKNKDQKEKDENEKKDKPRLSLSGRTSAKERQKRKDKTPLTESLSSSDLKGHQLLQEMPDRVVQLVEQMISERNKGQTKVVTDARDNCGKNIVLNIWDFAGQAVYYTTHQVFLSSRAVYVIVFNLNHDLDQIARTQVQPEPPETAACQEGEFTNLDYMDYWMGLIHAHTAQNTRNSVDNKTLSPPIFLVGTHRASLAPDAQAQLKIVEERFQQIKMHLQKKSYHRHVVTTIYAVENNMEGREDEEIAKLRRHIEEVASRESYMGEQIPIKWLRFEQAVAKLVEEGSYFVSLDQMREVACEEGINSEEEFRTLLGFYHDLGVIIYYGKSKTLDNTLRNIVILKPQWLVDMFQRVMSEKDLNTQWLALRESWQQLERAAILEESLINHVWRDFMEQKPALLGLMEKFDLIALRLPQKNLSGHDASYHQLSYYVPSRMRNCPESYTLYTANKKDVTFYLDFCGFLPDGLFHRLVTRAIRWSQECEGHDPQLFYRKGRFFLDSEHDIVLEMASMKLARIKVSVLRIVDLEDSDDCSSDSSNDRPLPPPKPAVCAKVRNFLENCLSDLREMWMKRISYKAVVQCPCDRSCNHHNKPMCPEEACLHFLNLDECLSNKVVCCEHRRVKTAPFRKWFPSPVPVVKQGPILPESIVQEPNDNYGNIEANKGPELPAWVKSAAKLLNGGSEGQDWTTLAKKLGYKKNKIEKFNDDLNPGLALITDWIVSSGNTALSVDMMVTNLEQMQRDDIVEIIQRGQEADADPPQVFISYQWDGQDEVRALRDRIEKCGFTCWMDIGQMGGGDQLFAKIDEGIRNSKVFIACITPKYIVSHLCNRELGLADLLRKPIIPVMFEKVAWPPPGGMALVFSQLVYINMKGIGGHGGSGIHADLEAKYNEVIQRLSMYAIPTRPKSLHDSLSHLSPGKDHSDHSLIGSLDSPSLQDPMVIPGYNPDFMSQQRYDRPLQQNSGDTQATAQGPGRGVEQVHVTKCAVCTIL